MGFIGFWNTQFYILLFVVVVVGVVVVVDDVEDWVCEDVDWLLFVDEAKTQVFFWTENWYPSTHCLHVSFNTTRQLLSSNLQIPFLNTYPSLHLSHLSTSFKDYLTQFGSRHLPLLNKNIPEQAKHAPVSLS